jgi:hypothetical protein
MRWYRYGVYEGNWSPDSFKSASETKHLLRYSGTSGGLLNGLRGLREGSSTKRYVPIRHWTTEEGKVDLKQTAIADRCLQFAIDAAIQDDGRYDETTGEIAGCEEYLGKLHGQWKAREEETGCTPTADWASSEFGWRSEDTYTCDVGYLYTKNHHTVQMPHVDYGRRTQMMTNWVGFVPLTRNGMFVEVWPRRPTAEEIIVNVGGVLVDKRMQGSIMYIPYGVALLVRGDTVHAGGMHCEPFNTLYGNPRLHIYIKSKTLDVTYETNGNRWYDFDPNDVSDDDTPVQRAVREYPIFVDGRRDPDCMGYIDGDDQANKQRRGVSLSSILFSDVLKVEQKTLTVAGWAERHRLESMDKSRVAGRNEQLATKQEQGAKIEAGGRDVAEEDKKPAAKRSRKKGGEATNQESVEKLEEVVPGVAGTEGKPAGRRSPRKKGGKPGA